MMKFTHAPVNTLTAVAQLLNEVRVFLNDAIAKQEDLIQERLAAKMSQDGSTETEFHDRA